MHYTLAIVSILLALGIGLVANRWWWRTHGAGADDGLKINDLVVPITTLAVVLIAFVMVEGITSHGRARALAAEEARTVDLMAHRTLLLADRDAAAQLQAALICYVRAVRAKEWPQMASGEAAPEAAAWTATLRAQVTAAAHADERWAERLLDSESTLRQTRAARLSEARPTIPVGLSWLMFGAVFVSVLGLAFFMRPHGSGALNMAVLAIFTVLMAATLWMISDLDHPFTGVNNIQSTELAHIQPVLAQNLAQLAPNAALPCDADGAPTR